MMILKDLIKEKARDLLPGESADLDEWRIWLVNGMFYCGLVFIPIASLLSFPSFILEEQYDLIVLDALVCIIFVMRLFIRSLSPHFWAMCWLTILYVMATSFFIRLGPHYARSAWLVMNTVMAALVFGTKAALWTSLINPSILLGCYFLIGPAPPYWSAVHEDTLAKYLSFTINTSFMALATGLLVGFLLDRLNIAYRVQRKTNEALNESRSRYRLIAENIADVIWTMDMDLHFTYISPSIQRLQGFTAEEGMQKSIADFLLPESTEAILKLYQKRMKQIENGDEKAWDPEIFDARQYCKDGRVIWTSIHARILKDENNRPSGILGITRDITELRRTNDMMIQNEKMLSVGGLAAGMAHEINNPLAGMLQGAQAIHNRLTRPIPANDSAAEALGTSMDTIRAFMETRGILKLLDTITSAGRRAAEIVENMLSFSRKANSVKQEHPFEEIIDRAIALAESDYNLKTHFDFKHIVIKKDYQPGIQPVHCEQSKIQQVLFNILKNASEAMASKSYENETPEIAFCLVQAGPAVCLTIRDNGPGMEESIRRRIFEPFFTTKGAGRGTGLGLSVSYFIIVDDHGGEMEVMSTPGEGTSFLIKLPVKAANVS